MVAAIVLFQVHQVVVLDSKKTLEVQMSSSMIRKDYSDIVGLDDLQRRSALITELCYVSLDSFPLSFVYVDIICILFLFLCTALMNS